MPADRRLASATVRRATLSPSSSVPRKFSAIVLPLGPAAKSTWVSDANRPMPPSSLAEIRLSRIVAPEGTAHQDRDAEIAVGVRGLAVGARPDPVVAHDEPLDRVGRAEVADGDAVAEIVRDRVAADIGDTTDRVAVGGRARDLDPDHVLGELGPPTPIVLPRTVLSAESVIRTPPNWLFWIALSRITLSSALTREMPFALRSEAPPAESNGRVLDRVPVGEDDRDSGDAGGRVEPPHAQVADRAAVATRPEEEAGAGRGAGGSGDHDSVTVDRGQLGHRRQQGAGSPCWS